MIPTRPLIRYHGGKWLLAPWILSHFPAHRVYVEPFGGGGSVLLRKQRSYAEVYNDLDSEVVNLFMVARDNGYALKSALELTPFSREDFERAWYPSDCPLEQARRTVVRAYMGFGSAAVSMKRITSRGGKPGTGFRANSNRSGTTPAHDWKNYPSCLVAIMERLQGVVIENRTAAAVIKAHDSESTLHYVDPPYVFATRDPGHDYRFELDDAAHEELAATLTTLKGMVVLSGYPCALYDSLYRGWRRVERRALADGAAERTEVLWISPNVSDHGLFSQGGGGMIEPTRIIGDCRLYLGDAREVMAALGPDVADLVCTDAPYRVTAGGKGQRTRLGRSGSDLRDAPASFGGWMDTYDNDGAIVTCDIEWADWLPGAFACLKPDRQAYFMTNGRSLKDAQVAAEAAGFDLHTILVWDKKSALPNRWYQNITEFTLFMRKGRAFTIHEPSSKNLFSLFQRDDSDHPTEKPVELMMQYIRNSTERGQTVLEPFMGSGTTGVAAARLARQFIGIEIEKRWFDVACDRIARANDEAHHFEGVTALAEARERSLFGEDDHAKVAPSVSTRPAALLATSPATAGEE